MINQLKYLSDTRALICVQPYAVHRAYFFCNSQHLLYHRLPQRSHILPTCSFTNWNDRAGPKVILITPTLQNPMLCNY